MDVKHETTLTNLYYEIESLLTEYYDPLGLFYDFHLQEIDKNKTQNKIFPYSRDVTKRTRGPSCWRFQNWLILQYLLQDG